ncbi:3-isopropylmalate dehydratase small subunit [Rubritalea marina]|uniref:3-isopropylmalate dehydratase small subunit n=1 Tax=Rubritalea marina TaxID=361055 RepID=UPI00037BA13A|nr:3-isopropylmalate dehydratase small subunit [Rubritalea marina]
MAIESIKQVAGTAVPVPGADVDTDRIIPARFLKCVTFDDLAEGMFYDERFEQDGSGKNHPIDQSEYQGASVMVVGPNFGCGSSREHAPQSIRRFGFRAIVGVSFAEIFFGNSVNLGMPCVSLSLKDNEKLMGLVAESPRTEVKVDLEAKTVSFANEVFAMDMPDGAREALVQGKWDTIGELASNETAIEATAAKLSYV